MMTHNKNKRDWMALFWMMCALLFAPLIANATTLVYPGDPNWKFDNRNSAGTAVISAINPRGYCCDAQGNLVPGNASLALTTSGSPDDWAFYSTYAGGGHVWNGTAFGLLSAINQLSFDWYRDSYTINYLPYQNSYWGGPWHAQTPVLRLLIENGDGTTSELVWEQWYNEDHPFNYYTPIDTWVPSGNLAGQNFWEQIGSTIEVNTLSGWVSQLSNAQVYGVSVGVGSAWYDAYSGNVDNIFLSFNGSSVPAIDANFEFPIPEPSACWLVAFGLSFWAAALWWWRKKKQYREKGK